MKQKKKKKKKMKMKMKKIVIKRVKLMKRIKRK